MKTYEMKAELIDNLSILNGRTIKKVIGKAINCIEFELDDGMLLRFEGENVYGMPGVIPYRLIRE